MKHRENRLKPAEIALRIFNRKDKQGRAYRFISLNDRLYRYHRGVYRPSDEGAAQLACCLAGEDSTTYLCQEAVEWLKRRCRIDPAEVDAGKYINVRNGLLDWRTEELHPHAPDYFSIRQIPVDWNPEARSPRLIRFLREVLPDKGTIRALVEGIGYTLQPRCHHQKAFLLLGEGANGKSVFLSLLRALLGKGNVSAIKLQDFDTNRHRFAAAQIVGKVANIFPDLPRSAIHETDAFKALVAGEEITVEEKYGRLFQYQNTGKLWFSANELPPTSDVTLGFFRRWLLVPFPNTFEGSRADKNLAEKLTTDGALSCLLRLAVKYLRRLEKHGHFTDTPATRRALNQYRRECDSVLGFVEEKVEREEGEKVSYDAFYMKYVKWCGHSGCKPLKKNAFFRRAKSHLKKRHGDFKVIRPQAEGKRLRYVEDLRIVA